MFISRWLNRFSALRRAEYRIAWIVALAADTLQIAIFPLFAVGGSSPLDSALDLGVGVVLTRLLGWHWAFLPSFAAELVPGLDLFPTWTAAVLFVTASKPSDEPEILPASGPVPVGR